MTIEELEQWLESARRIGLASGQDIGQYVVILEVPGPMEDAKIDHGANMVVFR